MFHDFINVFETHVMFNKNVIIKIEIDQMMKFNENHFDLKFEKFIMHDFSLNHVYMIFVNFLRKHVRKYKFVFHQNLKQKHDNFIKIEKVLNAKKKCKFRFVVNSNEQINDVVKDFINELNINIMNCDAFFFNHRDTHFLQFNDYFFAEKRFKLKIFVFFILND